MKLSKLLAIYNMEVYIDIYIYTPHLFGYNLLFILLNLCYYYVVYDMLLGLIIKVFDNDNMLMMFVI